MSLALLLAALIGVSAPARAGAPASLSKDEQRTFKELHQAVGLMEAFRKGRCPGVEKAMRAHLKEAELKVPENRDLRELVEQAALMADALTEVRVDEVERLRLRLHTLGDVDGFAHEASWHDEFSHCEPK